jgi:hypothetical protein
MGVDVALKNDHSAIAIVHIVRQDTENGPKEFIELDYIDARSAADEDKEYFRPEEITSWILDCASKFPIVQGTMDQYFGLAILPVLQDHGLKQFQIDHASAQYNSNLYQNLMSKMLDCSLRIPEGEAKLGSVDKNIDISLVTELLKLKATQHSKFLISVEAPSVKGLHDDMSDAYSRAVYLATDYINKKGSVAKSTLAQGNGPLISYKKYYRAAKRAASYTNRPSSTMMSEMMRGRQFGGFGSGRR